MATLAPASLYAAVAKVAACRGAERAKVAARFLQDFSHYHRDLRRLEILNAALDSVNLVATDKLQRTFPHERHASTNSSARGSTRAARGSTRPCATWSSSRCPRFHPPHPHPDGKRTQPGIHFSLNFYDPVNKLLGSTERKKFFLEGDAIILAILEREGEPGLAVSRACVLAREIIEIVRGYNELMKRSNMPELELGIGITLQETAPPLSHGTANARS